MISSICCFLVGLTAGWLAHKAEVESEKRRSAALAKVFDERRAKQ